MLTCNLCKTSAPDLATVCPSCGAALPENSTVRVSLKRIQENPRASTIQISVAGDCCPSCLNLQGTYSKDSVPLLPHAGCSQGNGCRCYYEPILTEIYP